MNMKELNECQRPQDEYMDGRGWSFYLCEHGGEYPDIMPQAIIARDKEGREATYIYAPSQSVENLKISHLLKPTWTTSN